MTPFDPRLFFERLRLASFSPFQRIPKEPGPACRGCQAAKHLPPHEGERFLYCRLLHADVKPDSRCNRFNPFSLGGAVSMSDMDLVLDPTEDGSRCRVAVARQERPVADLGFLGAPSCRIVRYAWAEKGEA